jgi:NADH-quinone oxidoreductase subunit D
VPAGEVYLPVESPRGELGCYIVADGGPKPYRLHVRGPSFVNLQAVSLLMRGCSMSDTITVISTIDPVMGEVDR